MVVAAFKSQKAGGDNPRRSLQNADKGQAVTATSASGRVRSEHGYDGRPSGFRHRSVFACVSQRSLSASRSHARGGTGGLARAIRHLGDGAASGSPRRPDRLADLLFVGRRGLERFPQRAAVASAEHHPGGRSAAAHAHPRGADAHPVAGGDQYPARDIRARGGSAGRPAGRAARIRRHCRSGRSLSAESISGRGRHFRGRPREPAALWQHGVQLVRSPQRLCSTRRWPMPGRFATGSCRNAAARRWRRTDWACRFSKPSMPAN